jgi:hypothetical protein
MSSPERGLGLLCQMVVWPHILDASEKAGVWEQEMERELGIPSGLSKGALGLQNLQPGRMA